MYIHEAKIHVNPKHKFIVKQKFHMKFTRNVLGNILLMFVYVLKGICFKSVLKNFFMEYNHTMLASFTLLNPIEFEKRNSVLLYIFP